MGSSGPGSGVGVLAGVGGVGVRAIVGVGDGGIRVEVTVGVGGVGVGMEVAVAVGAEVGSTGVEAACVCATADVASRAVFVLLSCALSYSRVAFALLDCLSSYSCPATVAVNRRITVANSSLSFVSCVLRSADINRMQNIMLNR